MSKNENNSNSEQQIMQDLFLKVKQTRIETSPYLKTRVLAHVKQAQNQQKTIRFWKFFATGSFAAMLLIGLYTFEMLKTIKTDAITNQAYVIHVEFNQEDLTKVAKAEVMLPEDVSFMSKGKMYSQRSMKLPVHIKGLGRGKLPFVVGSAVEGEKDIRIRLLDENDNLVREQVLKFKFAKTNQQVSL